MSYLSLIPTLLSIVPHILGILFGFVAGVVLYRYLLIKNPTLLNTLVTKASADISDLESLIASKKQVLPTAATVAAAVQVAPTLAAAPAASSPVVAAPVAVAAPAVAPAAPVAAPVAVAGVSTGSTPV